ncbi:hypothetical protein TI39_contig4193g00009 [Zymoseptoria brevis]|uniref:Uncharacterized protein n=1 Tax=Zymoseptoria brevis TaxID=1047168 RepID=A0A0F4GAP1_9PEZI|nr:hypothetical protein TI39_contig4193g00009 [Zymoseptoria brevis]
MASDPAPPSKVFLGIGDDYNDWRSKIFYVVKSMSPPNPRTPGYESALTDHQRGQSGFRQRSFQAAIIIHSHVLIDILERVPDDDRMDAPRLLAHLKTRCKAYKFMEHTTEIRSLIYSFLPGFPTDKEILKAEEFISLGSEKGRIKIIPAVAQVCSDMRIEVSRAIFTNRVFSFRRVSQLRYHDIQGHRLKFLSHGWPMIITLTVDANNKIQLKEEVTPIKYHSAVREWSDKLRKQIISVNKKSHTTGGEALRQMVLDN